MTLSRTDARVPVRGRAAPEATRPGVLGPRSLVHPPGVGLALVMPAVNCMNALLPFSVGAHSTTNRAHPVSLAPAICRQRKRRKRRHETRQCARNWGFPGKML